MPLGACGASLRVAASDCGSRYQDGEDASCAETSSEGLAAGRLPLEALRCACISREKEMAALRKARPSKVRLR
jgi:hypothetical protein